MTDLIPLIVGAVLVAVIHMSAPDHWVTLCCLGKSSGWGKRKMTVVSVITAAGHSVLSAILGLAVATVGLLFSRVISFYISVIIGAIMLVVGLFIGVRALVSKKKLEVTPEEKLLEEAESNKMSRLKGIGYFAVLGVALSPDLSITPIFLASVPVGLLFAVYLFIIFVAVSILTQVILVEVGTQGLAKTLERIPEKYNDALVGFVISAVGVFIILFG